MTAVNRFEEALLELGGNAEGLRRAAQADLDRRHRWHPWMKFSFAGRTYWMRVTNLRIFIYLQRDDKVAFTERWHD